MAGIAAALRGHSRVGLDTSVFIYHLEGSSRYAALVESLFNELAAGTFRGITSVLTLMELAVRPLQLGRPEVADEYEVILANYPNLTIKEIGRPIARRAAELRSDYRLRPADALQVAACLQDGATAFLSNDRDLRRVSEVRVLILEDLIQS